MLDIIYDATLLVDGEMNKSCRSGIYFVSVNILNKLLLRKDVNVFLWTSPSRACLLKKLESVDTSNAKCVLNANRIVFFLSKIETCLKIYAWKKERRFFFRKILWIMIYFMEFLSNLFFCPKIKDFSSCNPIFFSPGSAIPKYFAKQREIMKYVVLYDAIPFRLEEYKSQMSSGWFAKFVKTMDLSDCFFAISDYTKRDFCGLFPQLEKKSVYVTPLAASETFCPVEDFGSLQRVKEKYNLPSRKKFVFSLCTLEPRKNLIRAVKTFVEFIQKHNIDDCVWIMGGGQYEGFYRQIKQALSNLELYDESVFYIGYVDDKDLAVLYSNAEWFVYTSQYEGFGLPPLEAMQCGCPVITSNNSSLPEVVGDAGLMIDWDSDEQHVEAYEKYYFNEEFRKEKSQKGLERARMFSWGKTVDKMVAIMTSNSEKT